MHRFKITVFYLFLLHMLAYIIPGIHKKDTLKIDTQVIIYAFY